MARFILARVLPVFVLCAGLLVVAPQFILADEKEPERPQARFHDGWFFPNRPAAYTNMEGKPAPELHLDGWVNSDPMTLEDMRGKIVVVDLWATWCGPCIAAIPKNNQLARKYEDRGVMVLGICTSRGQEKMQEVIDHHRISYPSAKDPEQLTAKAWNVAFYPTYALVDREGVVRAMGLNPNHVERALQALLREQPEAPAAESVAQGG